MVASNQSRSPINWIGGKFYSAKHIISHFPHFSEVDVYCELFGGAAHVLMQKKPHKHIEIYNDINGDLVNFWMQCKNNAEVLEEQCRMLPYSRQLYYEYHYSLFDGTELEPLERAVRWFYVLRSNVTYLRLKTEASTLLPTLDPSGPKAVSVQVLGC